MEQPRILAGYVWNECNALPCNLKAKWTVRCVPFGLRFNHGWKKNMLLYKVKRNRLLKQKEDIHPASPFHKMGSNRRFSDPKSCKFPSVPWQIRARVGTFSPLCWCQNDALRMHRQVQLHHGFLKGPRRWHMDKLDIEFYRIM